LGIVITTDKIEKVEKVIIEEKVTEKAISIPLTADSPLFRRLGRILLAHAENRDPYHGPKTDAFSREMVEVFGFTAENTQPR
jgi:hypothetical protein